MARQEEVRGPAGLGACGCHGAGQAALTTGTVLPPGFAFACEKVICGSPEEPLRPVQSSVGEGLPGMCVALGSIGARVKNKVWGKGVGEETHWCLLCPRVGVGVAWGAVKCSGVPRCHGDGDHRAARGGTSCAEGGRAEWAGRQRARRTFTEMS